MDLVNQDQIPDETAYIFHSVNTFGKNMNLTNFPSTRINSSADWIFYFGIAINLGKNNSEFYWKIDLVLHTAHGIGVG